MKNLFKNFMPIAAAVIAITACNKEIENDIVVDDPNALHITVNASLEALQGESKTYIDDTTIKWGTGEYMKIGVFDGTATTFGNSTDESASIWNGEVEAMFNFSITPANTADTYTYYGIYPASAAVASNNTNPASYKVNLPAIQSATAASYDPKAYILIAKPEGGKTAANADWEASFRRATALNHLTLKNLSEDIKKVTITAPEGTYLAGSRHFDITASTMANQNGDIYSGGGRTNTVEVKYATKLTGGADMNVWFTSWDAEIAVGAKLTIVAYSDAHTFTREITVTNKPITFKEGWLNNLSVNMSSAVQGDNTELDPGDYVILAANNTTYYALKAAVEGTSSRMDYVSYTGSTSSYTGTSEIVWTVAKETIQVDEQDVEVYTIANDGKYLGWSSGNSALWNAASNESGSQWTTDNYGLDIDWKTDHYEIAVHSSTDRILAKNTGSYGFAFYTGSGYKNIIFVPATVDNRAAVTLAFEAATAEFTNQSGSYDEFLGYDVTATAGETDITSAIASALEWSKEDDDEVIDEFDNGALTLTGNTGTATVKVSFPGDETYLPAEEVSYTITVTDGSTPTPTTGWFETALADLTTSDVFVIVGNDTYTISNAQSTSAAPAAATLASASVTISGTTPNRSLSGTIPDGVKWTLTGNGTDGYTFYSNANSSYHLYNSTTADSKSNDAMRVGNPSSGTDRKLFILDNGNHLVTKDSYTARYLACYTTTPEWRGYVSSSTSETTITFYKYVAAPDTREEAGMSWSSDSATATYTTVNNANSLAFTAPTLTLGNATSVTYESTDETIATISNAGVVSINLTDNTVKEGSTTIKAVFEGDEEYKPQTVSYTLTVVDSRTAATTPTFNPAAGEVTANQVVTFQPTDQGLTFHYTVDGTDPVVGTSSTGASVTIDAAKTVKVIATKTGYKPSAVASAAYTIAGVVTPGTEDNPYSASAAASAATATAKDNVYVKGIVSAITGAYNSNYGNVTFTISDDGLTTSTQFTAFRTTVSSANDVAVGDCVVLKGSLQLYNSTTPELLAGNTIQSRLSMPSFASGDENFTTSTSVTLSAASGATIYYTTDGTNPDTNSSTYSSAIPVSATTTIKAIAEKDGLVTGVASKTFTKVQTYAVTWSAPSNGSITVKQGETTISSGALVPQGATINITVSPADGYVLSTLVYNDGLDNDIKSAKSFSMPAHAVSITATFEAGSNTPDPVTLNIYSNAASLSGSGATQTATWTSGDITVSAVRNAAGNTQFRSSDTDHTRFYSGWTLTIESASNTIDQVEFTCTSNAYATTLAGYTFTNGSAAASSSKVTVSKVNASSTSVTLSAQVRISSIKVTYK